MAVLRCTILQKYVCWFWQLASFQWIIDWPLVDCWLFNVQWYLKSYPTINIELRVDKTKEVQRYSHTRQGTKVVHMSDTFPNLEWIKISTAANFYKTVFVLSCQYGCLASRLVLPSESNNSRRCIDQGALIRLIWDLYKIIVKICTGTFSTICTLMPIFYLSADFRS